MHGLVELVDAILLYPRITQTKIKTFPTKYQINELTTLVPHIQNRLK